MFLSLDDSNFNLNREETPHESFIQHLKPIVRLSVKGRAAVFFCLRKGFEPLRGVLIRHQRL